jgi:hypothetical protein
MQNVCLPRKIQEEWSKAGRDQKVSRLLERGDEDCRRV